MSNNISFFSSYSQNTTNTKTTTINNLNLFSIPANKTKVGDIDIGYKQNGTGSPIVLITGFSASMNNWNATLINNLSKNHNFTIHQFAQDTLGLMNALNINKTDIMGFSMGSYIAQDIALSNPEKINKLVLYAPVCGGPESTPLHENLTKIALNSKNATEFYRGLVPLIFPKELIVNNKSVIDNIAEKFPLDTPMNTLRNQYSAVNSWYNTGVCNQLGKIDIPTLIIVGT